MEPDSQRSLGLQYASCLSFMIIMMICFFSCRFYVMLFVRLMMTGRRTDAEDWEGRGAYCIWSARQESLSFVHR